MLLSSIVIAFSPVLFIILMMIFQWKKIKLPLVDYLLVTLSFAYVIGVISFTLFPVHLTKGSRNQNADIVR